MRTKRLNIPTSGSKDLILFTKGRLKVAVGYSRVILGKTKVIEFSHNNVVLDNFVVPFHKKWQEEKDNQFIEYTSKDYCRLRLVYNTKTKIFCVLAKGLIIFDPTQKKPIEVL